MTALEEQALRGAADTLRGAMNDSALQLERRQRIPAQNYRVTLLIVAGAAFMAGFLWAKTRAQTY